MKRILLFFSFLVFTIGIRAQPYGNEWIDPNLTYYKIQVSQDGIYRIPASLLSGVIQLGTIDSRSFTMFHNGKQIPIYVSAAPGSPLSSTDYIEFYGERNKGYIDSLLYRSSYDQINPDYSLFTNTSVYFITHNSSSNNPRLVFEQYNNNGAPPKEEYFMHKSLVDFPDKTYYEGNYYQSGNTELYKSPYDPGEGYIRTGFLNQSPISFTVNTPFVYTQGPNATLRTYFANHSRVNNQNHRVEIKLNNNFLFIQPSPAVTSGFQLVKDPINVAATQLISGSNTLIYRDLGTSLSLRSNAIGFIEMEYPRQFNFGGTNKFYFKLAANSNKQYLEITGFNSSGTQPLLYDLTNGRIYPSIEPAGAALLKFQILSSGTDRDMYLRSDNANSYTEISQISSGIRFPSYPQSDYYIISHSNLRNDGTGNDPVEEYRAYRANKYLNCQIADIEMLYDQFGYGIRKSPLAIRNFINYAKATFDLKYVFIIGKGRENFKIRDGGSAYNQCLVPTFGYPGSDNLLASSRGSDLAQVAVGRLAAENRTQVRDYLEKIEKYEKEQDISMYASNQAIAPKIWQKELLHFSGGTTRGEQTSFRGFVDSYGRTAKDTLWGANTTTYSKTSSAPIDQSLSQIIKNRINEGVSWITFFGHSSTGAFDFSIDEPENYDNSPKFPIILSNGCFSGFIHDVTQGYSERFVFEPDKAAIAFMATSSLSLPVGLHKFSTELYNNICVKNYFQPLGKSFQQAYNDIICCTVDNTLLGVAYEMTLHGDPGIMLNQYPKPDYAIEASSVYFNPATISAGVDSFEVNIIVTNLGRAIDTNITVSLRREVSDISNPSVIVPPYTYLKVVPAPYYKDTVTFKLPVTISTLGYGQNTFYPYVDAGFEIDEMAEQNNGLTIPVTTYIQNDDIIPIYPYEFAIVPQKGVTLKASTINPFAPLRSYEMQIDTSERFANPIRETVITQIGGVVRWTTDVSIYQKDSTVFYWRVRRDSDSAEWHYSSFIYLQGEYPGWNQSHLFQWQKDDYLYMNLDSNDRVFKFPSTVHNIRVNTGFADASGGNVPALELGWYLNNVNMHLFRFGRCNGVPAYLSGGLTFAVIDNVTGLPWSSQNYLFGDNFGDPYGNVHCLGYGPQYGFDFPIDANHGSTIPNFIDAIPNGFYVLIYSVNDPISGTMNWHPNLVQALQGLGFDLADEFEAGTRNGPFTFFTQKGNSSFPSFFANKPAQAAPNYAKLDTSFNFSGNWNSGQFTSPKIGPAVEWGSVHWVHDPLETPNTDRDTMDVIGVKADGTESVLLTTVALNNFISNISAVDYPYLKLRLRTRDDVSRTPTQLKYWRVLYKKPPEAAINPAVHFRFDDTIITVGRTLHLEIALENVTDVPMDSMLTKYVVRDAASANRNYYIRYDTLGGLDTMHLIFDFPVDAANYVGLNKIIIEANPDDDQIEQYHFNNIAEINFTATGDKINPLLDVTFDNQHIMNGDIVSAKPNILITLKDENKYLALNDQSLIDVYLKYPGQNNPTKIDYDNSILTFYPADSANLSRSNKAHAEFKPVLTLDGKYELIVKDRDRSGNNSSTYDGNYNQNAPLDYQISFEVINKPMITNVLNYPNPFTTATKFVFTVTGSEVPDFLKIQIMTIKGTVVKEITKAELGDVHVGRNITEYTWDGRDQYGDLLANGVYFYHVSARLDDKRMDRMSQTYDKYFKKGFGKMVIIR